MFKHKSIYNSFIIYNQIKLIQMKNIVIKVMDL